MPEEMETTDFDQDQDNPLGESVEEGQSGEEGGGEGGGGEAPQTVKVGDKEYTLDQLTDLEKKARDYDALLPDYTRKSQKLADLETKGQEKADVSDEDQPPYYNPEWVPKSYQELAGAIRMAEERGEKRALAQLQKMEAARSEAAKQVDEFVSGIKEKDSEFDDQDFYEFVAKHDLPANTLNDLKSAYSVYRELRTALVKAGGADDKKRKDSVSGPVKGGGKVAFSVPRAELRRSGSAVDAVRDAFSKIKK